jgi:hypothetical protein
MIGYVIGFKFVSNARPSDHEFGLEKIPATARENSSHLAEEGAKSFAAEANRDCHPGAGPGQGRKRD